MAKVTREMKHNENPTGTKPVRETVKVKEKDERLETTIQVIQDGHDVDHTEKLKKHNTRKDVYEENKSKACASTMSLCNKTMKHRAEEAGDFEDETRDDPTQLSKETRKKMCDPARAKHEHASLTLHMKDLLLNEQDNEEDLTGHTKRMKQQVKMFEQTAGKSVLHEFVESTAEHQKEMDAAKKEIVKKESFLH